MENTENVNKAAGAPSELNVGLGAWLPINLQDDQPIGDDDVLVARDNGDVGMQNARTVRALKRAAIIENDTCVFVYWMPKPIAPNAKLSAAALDTD